MITITINYTSAEGATVNGWARIPYTAFPLMGFKKYLEAKGCKDISIYKSMTGNGIEMDRKKNLDNLMIEAIRDNRYYGEDMKDVVYAYAAMGPNYQSLLTNPKHLGAMI